MAETPPPTPPGSTGMDIGGFVGEKAGVGTMLELRLSLSIPRMALATVAGMNLTAPSPETVFVVKKEEVMVAKAALERPPSSSPGKPLLLSCPSAARMREGKTTMEEWPRARAMWWFTRHTARLR